MTYINYTEIKLTTYLEKVKITTIRNTSNHQKTTAKKYGMASMNYYQKTNLNRLTLIYIVTTISLLTKTL